jgi:hypothetical protein
MKTQSSWLVRNATRVVFAVAAAAVIGTLLLTAGRSDPEPPRVVYTQPAPQALQAPAPVAQPQVVVQQAPQSSNTGDMLLSAAAGAAAGYMLANRNDSAPAPVTHTRVIERVIQAPSPSAQPVKTAAPLPTYVKPPVAPPAPAPKPVAPVPSYVKAPVAPAPKPTYAAPPRPPAPTYARPAPAPRPSPPPAPSPSRR